MTVLSAEWSRGDLLTQPSLGDYAEACRGGFPHPYLLYLAGGAVNPRTETAQLRYRCMTCGMIVEFKIVKPEEG